MYLHCYFFLTFPELLPHFLFVSDNIDGLILIIFNEI